MCGMVNIKTDLREIGWGATELNNFFEDSDQDCQFCQWTGTYYLSQRVLFVDHYNGV
jgi:hypothetical protein